MSRRRSRVERGTRCSLYRNGGEFRPGGGKVLYIRDGMTITELHNVASRQLDGHAVRRCFSAHGIVVDDPMMVEEDGILFCSDSSDEPYRAPRVPGTAGGAGSAAVIVGGYQVAELLGTGAFGAVHLGVHAITNQKVALKSLNKRTMASCTDAERVFSEVHCLEALSHENVIKLYRVLQTPDAMVLVFEYAEGGDLRQYLQRHGGWLSEKHAFQIFSQILAGVAYCHKNHIVHHDLKLENILLTCADAGANHALRETEEQVQSGQDRPAVAPRVKIADFGLSAVYSPGTLSDSTAGTVAFLAPEVLLVEGPSAGMPRDVWSLGIILFAMLTGRLPFEASSAAQLRRLMAQSKAVNFDMSDDTTERTEGLAQPPRNILTQEARALLARMLQFDPACRATVSDVALHPWMRRHGVGGLSPYDSSHRLLQQAAPVDEAVDEAGGHPDDTQSGKAGIAAVSNKSSHELCPRRPDMESGSRRPGRAVGANPSPGQSSATGGRGDTVSGSKGSGSSSSGGGSRPRARWRRAQTAAAAVVRFQRSLPQQLGSQREEHQGDEAVRSQSRVHVHVHARAQASNVAPTLRERANGATGIVEDTALGRDEDEGSVHLAARRARRLQRERERKASRVRSNSGGDARVGAKTAATGSAGQAARESSCSFDSADTSNSSRLSLRERPTLSAKEVTARVSSDTSWQLSAHKRTRQRQRHAESSSARRGTSQRKPSVEDLLSIIGKDRISSSGGTRRRGARRYGDSDAVSGRGRDQSDVIRRRPSVHDLASVS